MSKKETVVTTEKPLNSNNYMMVKVYTDPKEIEELHKKYGFTPAPLDITLGLKKVADDT